MLATGIIVFREVLEAALIIGILAAATRDVPGRERWLTAGLLMGLAGSCMVAASTSAIASFASGIGQELFNAIVLGIAVTMLAWHSIWMSSHGAELAHQARQAGARIRDGYSERSILLVITGLAVLREGSETVLFLYGVSASGNSSAGAMLTGGGAGLAAGILVGYAIYAGLIRIPMRWFFAATGALVLLLAAGMASNAAKYLIQADVLPSLASPLWDTTNALPEDGLVGMLLHSLVGYDASPSGMQVVFFLTTLLSISLAMALTGKQKKLINSTRTS